MHELDIDIKQVLAWFPQEKETPYILVRVTPDHANDWKNTLRDAVRRCYLTDDFLCQRIQLLETELQGTPEFRQAQIINSKLPDPGSTMAGDFGEILIYLYLSAKAHPKTVFGPKKWRLKQDRTKPAPGSDVIQFILPKWPIPSEHDELLCAEVKLKSTNGDSSPIKSAIDGCAKDRTSRLLKTLLWLRARAIGESLGTIQITHLNRFINAIDYPPAKKHFHAIAVIGSEFLDAELLTVPAKASSKYTLVVVAVPDLHTVYNSVFKAAKRSTLPQGGAL